MSLDEYVLNFYDRLRNTGGGGGGGSAVDTYPSPSGSSSGGHHRHPNLTIHECTNESTDSGGGVAPYTDETSSYGNLGGGSSQTTKPKLSNIGKSSNS